jgi:hypothetical protein
MTNKNYLWPESSVNNVETIPSSGGTMQSLGPIFFKIDAGFNLNAADKAI